MSVYVDGLLPHAPPKDAATRRAGAAHERKVVAHGVGMSRPEFGVAIRGLAATARSDTGSQVEMAVASVDILPWSGG